MIDPSNQDYVLCKVAKCPDPKISRGGGKGAKYITQNVTYHMDRYHPKQFGPFLQAAAEKKSPSRQRGQQANLFGILKKKPMYSGIIPAQWWNYISDSASLAVAGKLFK